MNSSFQLLALTFLRKVLSDFRDKSKIDHRNLNDARYETLNGDKRGSEGGISATLQWRSLQHLEGGMAAAATKERGKEQTTRRETEEPWLRKKTGDKNEKNKNRTKAKKIVKFWKTR
jgi:hypothetical protein